MTALVAEEEDEAQGVNVTAHVGEGQVEASGVNVTAPEAEGLADEGERIPGIVERMNNEDHLVQQIEENGDSSDDEEAPVPASWRDPGFGNPVVQDGRRREWEYRANEVVQGAKYATIEQVREAVKLWSLSLMKEFRVVKSSSRDYDVKCVNEDCPWRVHAHKGKFKSHWECTIVVEHTCLGAGVEKANRNLTSSFVANEMYGLVVENMEYEPKQIIRQIALKYKYTISYAKAWRAKQKVFEMRFGTFEASYDNLPRMLPQMMQRNPGSYFDLYSLPVEAGGGPRILQRVFFLFGCLCTGLPVLSSRALH
jgi:hypothetical protein